MGVPYGLWVLMNPHLAHMHPDHPGGARPAPATPVAVATAPGRSKYGAVRTEYRGRRYASKAEAARAERLDWERSQGLVRFVYPQPRFTLGVKENVYVADFLVVGPTGEVWVEDVKGVETSKFKRDVKLWRAYGPCPLRVLKGGKVVETIVPTGGTGK